MPGTVMLTPFFLALGIVRLLSIQVQVSRPKPSWVRMVSSNVARRPRSADLNIIRWLCDITLLKRDGQVRREVFWRASGLLIGICPLPQWTSALIRWASGLSGNPNLLVGRSEYP